MEYQAFARRHLPIGLTRSRGWLNPHNKRSKKWIDNAPNRAR